MLYKLDHNRFEAPKRLLFEFFIFEVFRVDLSLVTLTERVNW